MKFKQFTKAKFLRGIGRHLLGQFFDRFKDKIQERSVRMPPPELEDDAYFDALSQVGMSPDGLPDGLIEAMYAVEDMANHEGQERLEKAVTQAGLNLTFEGNSSHADIALQVWLVAPDLMAEKHNEQRLQRLSTFEYFGSKAPADRRSSFTAPSPEIVDLMTRDCDEWFPRHSRGQLTTHIEVHRMDGEFWFLVRHGDTFARTPKVENRKTEVIHFRPAVDDVAVYSPERDEIRIHAGTKGEKELYRKVFGMRLFADEGYFSERKAYTLEPLRTDGAAALDTDGLEGIRKIVLREIEIAFDNGFNEVVIRKSDDIFAAAEDRGVEAIGGGRLVRAALDFYFGDSKKPRKVQVRVPNVLKLGRHCDAALVHRWLSARGFRVTANTPPARGGLTHVEPLAVP